MEFRWSRYLLVQALLSIFLYVYVDQCLRYVLIERAVKARVITQSYFLGRAVPQFFLATTPGTLPVVFAIASIGLGVAIRRWRCDVFTAIIVECLTVALFAAVAAYLTLTAMNFQ